MLGCASGSADAEPDLAQGQAGVATT
jgi:hypothetical protein